MLFSIPLSGLTASSDALSVISNNLANLNTDGYKGQNAEFKDLLYQTIGSNGSGDPLQIGGGTAVGTVATDFTDGSPQSTGVNTDVAISGNGFFITQNAQGVQYTRAGDFTKSPQGFLTTTDGSNVMGYQMIDGVPGQVLTPIQITSGAASPPAATSTVQMNLNLNSGAAVNNTYSTPIQVYDPLGNTHTLTMTFTKTAANTWSYSMSLPQADLAAGAGGAAGAMTGNTGTLTFDNAGNLLTPAADVTGISVPTLANGASGFSFKWQLYNGTTPDITQTAQASAPSSTYSDGNSSGSLRDFQVGTDGTITGTFTNGQTAAIAQIALASFTNPQGLNRVGGNNFAATSAAGNPSVGAPGTGDRGSVAGDSLESSNVDIATQFSQLIVSQRFYEANAKVITTFDQVTQDTLALKQ